MALPRSMDSRFVALTVTAAAVELATMAAALYCLSRPHDPWLWGVVLLGAILFYGLLKLQSPAPAGVLVFYALLSFILTLAWFFLVDHLVLTLVDGLAMATALLAYLYFHWRSGTEAVGDDEA